MLAYIEIAFSAHSCLYCQKHLYVASPGGDTAGGVDCSHQTNSIV